jgi:23S rRNA (cytidine2498-2'-O)-methyltransferase
MRRGFLTFKCSATVTDDQVFATDPGFARRIAIPLGKVGEGPLDERTAHVWKLAEALVPGPTQVHVWPREGALRPTQPTVTEATEESTEETGTDDLADDPESRYLDEVREALARTAPPAFAALDGTEGNGETVLDVCVVSPAEWWVGWHRATGTRGHWPGGVFEETLPSHAVSRGYLKIREALAWSGFSPQPDESIAEIGCSPGGASQALLDMGLLVQGFDPAEVAPEVTAHPRFQHWRMRSKDAPRKAFVGLNWLYVDINLPPNYTLDTVEGLLSSPGVDFTGLLLTLKLPDWELADELPRNLERVRGWGFEHVAMRQLTMNRQEVCVAAR